MHGGATQSLQQTGMFGRDSVNYTCFHSKCIDIPTYNAVHDLAEQGAGAEL
jgi:hypothetical protein